MSTKQNQKVGFGRPSFIGWTIFQIMFAESFMIDLRCKFGNTTEIQSLTKEIPKGEGEAHAAVRSFEDWRKAIKNYYQL